MWRVRSLGTPHCFWLGDLVRLYWSESWRRLRDGGLRSSLPVPEQPSCWVWSTVYCLLLGEVLVLIYIPKTESWSCGYQKIINQLSINQLVTLQLMSPHNNRKQLKRERVLGHNLPWQSILGEDSWCHGRKKHEATRSYLSCPIRKKVGEEDKRVELSIALKSHLPETYFLRTPPPEGSTNHLNSTSSWKPNAQAHGWAYEGRSSFSVTTVMQARSSWEHPGQDTKGYPMQAPSSQVPIIFKVSWQVLTTV